MVAKENNKTEKDTTKSKNIFVVFAFIIFVLAIVTTIFLNIFRLFKDKGKTYIIKQDRIAEEENLTSIVIKNEKVISNSKDKELKKIKDEGEKASKNDDVFRYYSSREEKILERIGTIDSKIDEIMIKNKDSFLTSENKVIDSEIEIILENISSVTKTQKVEEYVKEVSEKLKEKAKKNSNFGASQKDIDILNKEKSDLEKRLTEETEIIKAPFAGIVSYKVDGYEEKLKQNKLDSLNLQIFKEVINKNNVENLKGCKIVDNFSIYLGFIPKESNYKYAEENKKIKIVIDGEKTRAKIIKVINVGKKKIVIVKVTENVGKLINERKKNIDIIWWEDIGLKASNKALVEINGKHYINKILGGNIEKIAVKIIKKTEDYSLVENLTNEERKKLGEEISKDMQYLKEYDEVELQNN